MGGGGGKERVGREGERPIPWPPPSLGIGAGAGRWSQRNWCRVCLSRGPQGGSGGSSRPAVRYWSGRAREQPSPSPWKHALQGPHVHARSTGSRKGWLGRFSVSLGMMRGFRGRPAISVSDTPSEGRPGPRPDRGSCSPWAKGHPS